MTLTIKSIDAAKPTEKPYKLSDASGLYLYIAPSGSKTWRCNYMLSGKQKTITYGRYPVIGLAEARKLNILRKSENIKKVAPTFKSIGEEWLLRKLPTLDNEKHKIQTQNTLRDHVFPHIGHLPIDKIPRKLLVDVIKELAHIPETASRVASRINMVLNYALDSGIIETHGAEKLSRVITKNKSKPHPSIKPEKAGRLLVDIMTYGEPVTRLGLLLVAHTFVRFNEIQGMRWDEIIWKDNVWVIPAERMKMSIDHVVPLSKPALAILEELKDYSDGKGLVIESEIKRGHTICENTMLYALYSLGYRGEMTVHGFRALASSVLNEAFPSDGDAIERQLAHKEKDAVRASYNRAEYLPRRRELMAWWSHWLQEQYTAQCQIQAND